MLSRDELKTAVHVLVEEAGIAVGDGSYEPTAEETTDAIMALYDAAPGREWTACVDAMPAPDREVEIADFTPGVPAQHRGTAKWYPGERMWWNKRTGQSWGFRTDHVTHWRDWQPLPAPPDQGKEE